MPEKMIAFLVSVLLALSATAQDVPTEDEAGSDSAAAEQADDEADSDDEANSEDEEDPADADLDDQTYEEDDDDFVPSEEIRADEPVPFPTDI